LSARRRSGYSIHLFTCSGWLSIEVCVDEDGRAVDGVTHASDPTVVAPTSPWARTLVERREVLRDKLAALILLRDGIERVRLHENFRCVVFAVLRRPVPKLLRPGIVP